jgi:hypothetical protein
MNRLQEAKEKAETLDVVEALFEQLALNPVSARSALSGADQSDMKLYRSYSGTVESDSESLAASYTTHGTIVKTTTAAVPGTKQLGHYVSSASGPQHGIEDGGMPDSKSRLQGLQGQLTREDHYTNEASSDNDSLFDGQLEANYAEQSEEPTGLQIMQAVDAKLPSPPHSGVIQVDDKDNTDDEAGTDTDETSGTILKTETDDVGP